MDKNEIVMTLKNHRSTMAKMRSLEGDLNKLLYALVNPDAVMVDKLYEAIKKVVIQYYAARNEVDLVNLWLCLLYDDERFLVSKHLIGGLTWPHVIFEYETRWGKENGRSERTMKRTQAMAIDKIASHLENIYKG